MCVQREETLFKISSFYWFSLKLNTPILKHDLGKKKYNRVNLLTKSEIGHIMIVSNDDEEKKLDILMKDPELDSRIIYC